jgi:plastocyanin
MPMVRFRPRQRVTIRIRKSASFALAAVCALACATCGGKSDTGGGTVTPPTGPSGNGGTSTTTITIANNAVTPKTITVSLGSRVTFVNNDTQSHDMESDPHPIHTDCPEINQVGFLNPGQSRQTAVLNVARTCGYHDHNRDLTESLQGSITIR